MFRELYKVVTTVMCELLFSGPTLFVLPHPPVVPLLFHLLRTDGNGNGNGKGGMDYFVRLNGCQLNLSSATARFQNQNLFSWPKFSL